MNVRRALIPLLCAMCMLASGCSDDNISIDTDASSTVASETQQSVLPPETTQPVLPSVTTQSAATSASASVLSMIPLPPDREYVEAFDPDNRTIALYSPCDDFTNEDLAEMGLERFGRTHRDSSLIDCGVKDPHQLGVYNIDTHFVTFEKIRSRGFMIDATFPDADDRVYFNVIRDEDDHCSAAVSTSRGRLSVVYANVRDRSLGRDELCRRAYEVLQKLRVKGGYE